MPRVPDLPLHLRFFGRVEAFHCECPKCGYLLLGERGGTRALHPKLQQGQRIWNPVTGRLRCPSCQSWFALGLLLYPVAGGGYSRRGERRPSDWKPTWEQLTQLRQLHSGAYVGGEAKAPGDFTNLYVEGECTCGGGGIDTAPCPLHGIEGRS